MGSHIEPLARWSNVGSSRFEARAVEPRVRYAHVPLARGPIWGFSQAEAERLDLHVILQHATRGAISTAPVSLDAPVERRNRWLLSWMAVLETNTRQRQNGPAAQ